MFKLLLFICAGLSFAGCEKKSVGEFGVEGSAIRYRHKNFTDKDQLAEANGEKFMKSQILDKSPVLVDLEKRENEALIGLAYLKLTADLPANEKAKLEVYLPKPTAAMDAILSRFGKVPRPGIDVVFTKSDKPGAAAKLGAREVTTDDLDRSQMVFQALEQRRFDEVASELNGQLSRILTNQKAMAMKMSLQDFVKKEILGGRDLAVNDQDLKTYLDSIHFSAEELTPELKVRFDEGIKQRKEQKAIEDYVAKTILKGPIDVAFEPPQTNLALNGEWKPVMGYADAPVSVVAFAGISCADCREFVQTVVDIMEKHDGFLKLNWIHNFNTNDGVAKTLAEAALCVETLKPGKSIAFIDEFAKSGSTIDEQAFYAWAKNHKVNEDGLKKCLVDGRSEKLAEQHVAYAKQVGIVANPTLWVNGRTLQGIVSEREADRVVSAQIDASGASGLSAVLRRIKGWF